MLCWGALIAPDPPQHLCQCFRVLLCAVTVSLCCEIRCSSPQVLLRPPGHSLFLLSLMRDLPSHVQEADSHSELR